ncbi:MAG: LPS export ABC transporter permease LptG [Pseudomonadota bacterium]
MNKIDGVFIRYVGRLFFVRFFGLLTFFVIILQMLDLLNNSTELLEPEGAGWGSIVKYIALRAPQIASQFTPFAALLAIVVTLTVLNHRSEITIMRAAGMAVHRVLAPIIIVCIATAAAHFAFHEAIVIASTEKLAYWEANDYEVGLPPDNGTRTNIRLDFGDEFIRAGSAARIGQTVRLNNVTINEFDTDNLSASVVEAQSALFLNDAWVLFGVRRHDAETLQVSEADNVPWRTALNPDLLFALSLNPDRTPLPDLIRKIRQLRDDGADTRAATTSLLGRFSKPLSTLVMPLLGAIAGFGVTRQGAQLARAALGAALGFGYFVIENMALALGKLGVIPAMLGAFFPFALFLVVGAAILIAMEN